MSDATASMSSFVIGYEHTLEENLAWQQQWQRFEMLLLVQSEQDFNVASRCDWQGVLWDQIGRNQYQSFCLERTKTMGHKKVSVTFKCFSMFLPNVSCVLLVMAQNKHTVCPTISVLNPPIHAKVLSVAPHNTNMHVRSPQLQSSVHQANVSDQFQCRDLQVVANCALLLHVTTPKPVRHVCFVGSNGLRTDWCSCQGPCQA